MNLCLAGGAGAEAPGRGSAQDQVPGASVWGARDWRSGGLDITFLVWLRGEFCFLFLVRIEPKTPRGSSWMSQALEERGLLFTVVINAPWNLSGVALSPGQNAPINLWL